MNHDYAHCMDYDISNCPKDCFRAALTEDLKNYHHPVSFMNLKGTEECPLYSTNCTNSAIGGEKRTNADRIRSMTGEELAGVIRNPCDMGIYMPSGWCNGRNCGFQCSLDWLKQEVSE